jgi:hypothetical protein
MLDERYGLSAKAAEQKRLNEKEKLLKGLIPKVQQALNDFKVRNDECELWLRMIANREPRYLVSVPSRQDLLELAK